MPHPQAARHYALAELHASRDEWAAARQEYLAAMECEPSHVDAMLQLSYLESISGSYRQAEAWAAKAAVLGPRHGETAISLVRRLRTFNRAGDLVALAESVMGESRPDVRVLVECSMQLSNLNDHDRALACARRAVELQPTDLLARMVRGQMLAQHGATDEAVVDYEQVLARAPKLASVWWALSRLRRQTPASNHVPQLRRLLAQALPPMEAAAAGFALHKELDDLGDVEGAWQALDRACRAKRGTLTYAPAATASLVDRLVAMPTRPAAVAPDAGAVPIFIVGMHRSGTTLLEQLLDASPQAHASGELYDVTAAMRFATDHHCRGVIDETIVSRAETVDFAGVGRRYLEGVAWRTGASRFLTDKLPSNFLNLGFICQALPQARILHMVRDPAETCFSNLRELFSEANPYSYDQQELAAFFLQYRRLMRHWHERFPGRILDVEYERLTLDPAGTMREVAGFCGLDYVDGMASTRTSNRAVGTASAMQVRAEVAARPQPKWQPYEHHLRPLIEALRAGGALD